MNGVLEPHFVGKIPSVFHLQGLAELFEADKCQSINQRQR